MKRFGEWVVTAMVAAGVVTAGFQLPTNEFVSVVAAIIALTALLLTRYEAHATRMHSLDQAEAARRNAEATRKHNNEQAEATRRHNRLSMKPVLVFDFLMFEESLLQITNKGTGPAVIKAFRIFLDGADVTGDVYREWTPAKQRLGLDKKCVKMMAPQKDTTLMPGETKMLIAIDLEGQDATTRGSWIAKLGRIGFDITYESFYGEEFRATHEPPGAHDLAYSESDA